MVLLKPEFGGFELEIEELVLNWKVVFTAVSVAEFTTAGGEKLKAIALVACVPLVETVPKVILPLPPTDLLSEVFLALVLIAGNDEAGVKEKDVTVGGTFEEFSSPPNIDPDGPLNVNPPNDFFSDTLVCDGSDACNCL